jgi:hypothetical protein
MDEKLNTLEARTLGLKRELDECKQGAAGVLQQRNELFEKLEDNSKKYTARLKADIEKEPTKSGFKGNIVETDRALAKHARDLLG